MVVYHYSIKTDSGPKTCARYSNQKDYINLMLTKENDLTREANWLISEHVVLVNIFSNLFVYIKSGQHLQVDGTDVATFSPWRAGAC